jgi:hypothetical protein
MLLNWRLVADGHNPLTIFELWVISLAVKGPSGCSDVVFVFFPPTSGIDTGICSILVVGSPSPSGKFFGDNVEVRNEKNNRRKRRSEVQEDICMRTGRRDKGGFLPLL